MAQYSKEKTIYPRIFVKRPEIERYIMIDDDMKRGKIVTDKDTTMYIPLKKCIRIARRIPFKIWL